MTKTDDTCTHDARTIATIDWELTALSAFPVDDGIRRRIDRLLDERIALARQMRAEEETRDDD